MSERFIAISEDEYNSFKHGEYERKIKKLEYKIEDLELENKSIANAKGCVLKIVNHSSYGGGGVSKIELLSDGNFENEILEAIKNTEFKHIINGLYVGCSRFYKEAEYIQIGDTFYYKNEWCEKLKEELSCLSSNIKSLEEKRNKLKSEIALLKESSIINDNDGGEQTFLRKIINKFSK